MFVRCCLPLVVVCLLLPAVSSSWEAPDHWSDLGTVSEWLQRDAQIWRFEGNPQFLNTSRKNLNQRRIYEDTFRFESALGALHLAEFQALDTDQRRERIRAAGRHLDYVVGFRDRMDTFVNRAQANTAIGWGAEVADVMAVGECLRHLHTAVGLDPANPYALHLTAMFAWVVGDADRSLAALAGAADALAEVPAGDLRGLRAAVALDRAWLLRDRGDFDGARSALDASDALGGPRLEVNLLRGLIAAQTGDIQTAVEQAALVSKVKIKRFPPLMEFISSTEDQGFWSPAHTNLGAWRSQSSDYLKRWILALAWLQQGQLDVAGKTFREYSTKDFYPLYWRFWNEAGRIYELTGRSDLATEAWATARVWRPYAPFFPVNSYAGDLGRLTGRSGTHPVVLGFDRFYVAGHRLVQGVHLLDGMTDAKDDMARLELAGQAMTALEECRNGGVYRAQSTLLLGALYHRVGDLQSAVLEVEASLAMLDESGDRRGNAAMMDELANVRLDNSPTGVRAFFGQSGSARTRWASPGETAGVRSALSAAYSADPSDENRRALARFLIRHDEVEAGLSLVEEGAANAVADMVLLLEADRALGDADRARELVATLELGTDPYDAAEVWTLAGFICLDAGLVDEGRRALARALELDPGNRALKVQMKLM